MAGESKQHMRKAAAFITLSFVCACGASQSSEASPAADYDSADDLALARQKNAEPLPIGPENGLGVEPEETDSGIGTAAEAPSAPAAATTPTPRHEPKDPEVRKALVDAEDGKLANALRRLRAQIKRIDKQAGLEDRMLARALMGRGYAQARQFKAARAEFDKVLLAWKDPKAAMQEITGGETSPAALARAGQALNAVGEALFFHAEQKRKVADALKPPTYRGRDSNDAIQRFMQKRISPWLQKRRRLIDEAQRAYLKITALRPAPPPRWVVASAAQVAAMLEALVADMRKVPLPPSVRNSPDAKRTYEQALSRAMEPTRKAAAAATATCRQYARKFRVESKYSRQCEADQPE